MKTTNSSPATYLARIPGQAAAVALETIQQGRGLSLWLVIALGGAAALWAGFGLSGESGESSSLTAFCFYNGLSILLFAWAMAAGARGLAGDRTSGLGDLIQSRPLSGSAYYLGRFAGLAARISVAAFLAAAAGGVALSLLEKETGYPMVVEPFRFEVGDRECPLGTPVLLSPRGDGVHWFIDGSSIDRNLVDQGEPGLRFTFRIRLPRDEPLQGDVPLHLAARFAEETVLDEEIAISLRNELSIPLDLEKVSGGSPQDRTLHVFLSVAGGHNFLEIDGNGCSFITRETGPLRALGLAMLSFLPVLWTALALGLFLSAVVGEPIALAAVAVLSLVVLAGPTLEGDFKLMAAGKGGWHRCPAEHDTEAHDHDGEKKERSVIAKTVASWAASAAARLPDPRAGGASVPLSRGECPSAGDAALPWREAAIPLLLFLLLGCLAVSRRWS